MTNLLTPMPFGLAGAVFRSPMPFGGRDDEGELLPAMVKARIDVVVPLAPEAECREESGRDLFALYREHGLEVLAFAIEDFGIPADEAGFARAVAEAVARARSGKRVLVHCSAGIGRTGTFLACMAVSALGLSASAAIDLVREQIPFAVETVAQRRLVERFART